ncbi:P-loop containing nucleoside triphosphate hydrolase [Arabidopsis thaliana x Arabidopsis arenosa]|uniref:Kinesin-like protein n=1 Tax=Arabidopsis thaliana x Arabidopsis arenosa TaxID=1240361 RepID=A0A8T2BVI5_9BRAS|nr:P-loop containing nucleoside triphosphate hydrolase [Arabidopsis thaliana x Arabidopsis arenosa]
MAMASSRNGAVRGSMRPISGANSSNLRSSSFKSRIPSSAPAPRRNSTSASLGAADNGVPGRVRVAVRLRPRNADESVADADFADCVELQPELKRLKLRKNNWDTETYEFDEVLTEAASQKRVYQVVAKPVVESVLEGYNGTVMAYGQTGTGKTFTLGRLGDEDTAARGIMVRSMEDIIGGTSLDTDSISVSYLEPAKFLELLQLGETHRVAANTKLNTESSRSHAILMVHVKRSVVENEDPVSNEMENSSHFVRPSKPLVRRSKLVLVDLAGSERVHKSGSEGHMLEEAKSINLSLSALGKCINAIAENSPHVPLRTARTSLIVTIGPSPRHRGRQPVLYYLVKGSWSFTASEFTRLKESLENEMKLRKSAEEEVSKVKSQSTLKTRSGEGEDAGITRLQKLLEDEALQKKKLEEEVTILRSQLVQLTFEADQMRRCLDRGAPGNSYSGTDSLPSRHSQARESVNGQKAPFATLCEQDGTYPHNKKRHVETQTWICHQLNDVSVPIMFTYLPYGVLEVAVRRFNNDDPLIHTKVGHLSHFVACIMLPDYMVPSTPIEGLVFFFLGGSLLYWTFFVLIAFGILALLEDVRGSLTQPLV